MEYEFWFASLTRINSRKRLHAEKLAGSARELFFSDEESLKRMHIFSDGEIQWLISERKKWDVQGQWDSFQKKGIRFVPYACEDYPERLRYIYQPPYALFVKGKIPDRSKSVGIVGARMCSEYGRSIARMLGKRLAERQVQVISGMALGIDSAAHAGALSAKGKTFAVLGCGCDICYPRNSVNIYHNISESEGGILSEYPPGTEPKPYRFPERNRIISALSDVVVVVEAREKSGSLITADFALEQGKDIFAVPGRFDDALSKGCNRLVSQGAGILYDVDDFLENIGIDGAKSREPEKNAQISLEKEEILVYSCLGLHPKFINNIIEETGLNLLSALHALENLKHSGLAQETFQNYYSRCISDGS